MSTAHAGWKYSYMNLIKVTRKNLTDLLTNYLRYDCLWAMNRYNKIRLLVDGDDFLAILNSWGVVLLSQICIGFHRTRVKVVPLLPSGFYVINAVKFATCKGGEGRSRR